MAAAVLQATWLYGTICLYTTALAGLSVNLFYLILLFYYFILFYYFTISGVVYGVSEGLANLGCLVCLVDLKVWPVWCVWCIWCV
jgi:hypothetical protein